MIESTGTSLLPPIVAPETAEAVLMLTWLFLAITLGAAVGLIQRLFSRREQ